MTHARLWTAAAIIALVVVGGFVLSVPRTGDIEQSPVSPASEIVPTVALRDVYGKGIHTITGSIEAPNACAVISTEAILTTDTSGMESILVAISMPKDTGVCLQIPTQMDFKTSISAPADLPIQATVNGLVATTSAS